MIAAQTNMCTKICKKFSDLKYVMFYQSKVNHNEKNKWIEEFSVSLIIKLKLRKTNNVGDWLGFN